MRVLIKNLRSKLSREPSTDYQSNSSYSKESYDKISNLYLKLTRDNNISFIKYPNFTHIKLITKNDIYSNTLTIPDDKQVHLYNLYKEGKISKEIFKENINNPTQFFINKVSFREFLNSFNGLNNQQVDTKLKLIHHNVENKKFNFANYQYIYKQSKLAVIFNYLKELPL